MAEIILFDYLDYRQYLELKLRSKELGRGAKARLAEYLGCQPSFISQVLKSKSSFSLEQAFKVNGFLKHNPLEKEYFMSLVDWDRAGTVELKQYYEVKHKELIEKSKLVENQMEYEQLSEKDCIAYYNDFNHILIRNYIEIPGLNNEKSLQKKLNLSKREFDKALEFMLSKGLVKRNSRGELVQGHVRLHIKKDSPLATYVNLKARWQMISDYGKSPSDALNYMSYMTLPRSSFEDFKKRLRALIVDLNEHLHEEEGSDMMAALVIDYVEM